VNPSTITRWHALGLITATTNHPAANHPAARFNPYPADQPRPTADQVAAAGRSTAYRDQHLITGGQLADLLGVARSTIYKWYRLGLIEAVTVDYRGRHLYRPDQHAPQPADVTAARAASRNDSHNRPPAELSDPHATIGKSAP
jgi:hypothetical protein